VLKLKIWVDKNRCS